MTDHKAPYLHRSALQAEIDLYKSRGVTIAELNTREMGGRKGVYYPGSRIIRIQKSLPNYEKFIILLHEMGHDICSESQCRCLQSGKNGICYNFILSETHAWRYVLSTLLQYGQFRLLKAVLKTLQSYHPNFDRHEQQSVKPVQKSALWRKCVKAIDNS